MAATIGSKKTAKDAKAGAKKPSAGKRAGKKTYTPLTVLTFVLDLNELSVADRDRITEKIEQFKCEMEDAKVLVAFAKSPPAKK